MGEGGRPALAAHGSDVITLDTSAIIALLSATDEAHARVTTTLRGEASPYLVPAAVLGEVGSFIEDRYGQRVLGRFLDDLVSGAFSIDCGDDDASRIRTLTDRYADLPLGLVDAAVIACAERNGGRVMTLDQRDFSVVGREVPLTILPRAA